VLPSVDIRADRARTILRRPSLQLLGAGLEGVVLTDGECTYKVFDGWHEYERDALSAALVRWVGRFEACRHFRPLLAVECRGELPVLLQTYTPSEPWSGRPEGDIIGFLCECLHEGAVYNCVNPSNFRFFGGVLCLADYGADLCPFTWNGWVCMARRAWLSLQYAERPDLKSLLRASIAETELPELAGFDSFVRQVLAGQPSPPAPLPTTDAPPASHPFDPDCTLLVKVCFQEGDTLLWMVRHLVRQLDEPRRFLERRILLDPRLDRFPRQYASPDPGAARAALAQLLAEGTVNRVDIAPVDGPTVQEIYRHWFDLESEQPSAISGVPIAPQLWAFDQLTTRYVLQVDADAIVGRRDRAHDFIAEMKSALTASPDAVSIGFQIAHEEGFSATYDAPTGSYCPEVRCGLIDLVRLRALRPLPNELRDGRLVLTWYRSVQRAQEQRGLRSLRGGDARSFYVHPPNTAKTDRIAWFDVVDRVEQGIVPPSQINHVDLVGPAEAWAIPTRREEHLFVVAVDATSREHFPRLWQSLAAQSRDDWGALVIDSTWDPAVEAVARRRCERVTLVRNPLLPGPSGALRALARFVREPEAMIIPLRADDELLGAEALTHLRRRNVSGAQVIRAHVLEGMRPSIAPVAARLRALRPGDHPDIVASLLAGLLHTESAPVPGPWLRREHPVPLVEAGSPLPPIRAPLRPSPVGVLLGGAQQVDGADSVLFLRHAAKKAGSRFCSIEENHARELSRSGLDEARVLGSALSPSPDLVLCSPVARSVQTAKAIAEGAGSDVRVIVDDVLLGGRFHNHARWLDLKRELGWEMLVKRWIQDEIPQDVVDHASVVIPSLLRAIEAHLLAVGAQHAVVITQGYVNTAVFHCLSGQLDFSGGPLYGFWASRRGKHWGERWM